MAALGSRSHEWDFWRMVEVWARPRGSSHGFEHYVLIRVDLCGRGPVFASYSPDMSPWAAVHGLFAGLPPVPNAPFDVADYLSLPEGFAAPAGWEGRYLAKDTRGLFTEAQQSF